MNRIFAQALLVGGILASNTAFGLTTFERDTHIAQMFVNVGAKVGSCISNSHAGFSSVCGAVEGRAVKLAARWEAAAAAPKMGRMSARRVSAWRSEGKTFAALFATQDDDRYAVQINVESHKESVQVGWVRSASDGRTAGLSRLVLAAPGIQPSRTDPTTVPPMFPDARVTALLGGIRGQRGGAAHWSPDGAVVYTTHLESQALGKVYAIVRSWVARTGALALEQRIDTTHPSDSGFQSALAPDGKLLYVAFSRKFYVFETARLEVVASFEIQSEYGYSLRDIAVHPSRPEVALIVHDTVYVLDALRGTWRKGPSSVSSAQYTPDGRTMIVGARVPALGYGGARRNKLVSLLDATTLEETRSFDVPKGASEIVSVTVKVSPDGKSFFALGGETMSLVTLDGQVLARGVLPDDLYVYSPVWSPDGSMIAMTMFDPARNDPIAPAIWLIDARTLRSSYLLRAPHASVSSGRAAFSPDSSRVAVSGAMFDASGSNGIARRFAELLAAQDRAAQLRDAYLARLQALCESGQLNLTACLRAKTAINEGKIGNYPDLRDWLEGRLKLEDFLARFR